MQFNWLKSLLSQEQSTKRKSAQRPKRVTGIETLETRVVPAIYHVTGFADGAGVVSASGVDFEATSLRAAINDANAQPGADTIVLPAGTYTINTSGEGELLITSDIEIDGAGAGQSIIDNNFNAGRVFHITGVSSQMVTFDGITITKGLASDEGGGILLQGGNLLLSNSSVTENAVISSGAAYGGGISVNGSGVPTLVIENSTISNNQAYGGSSASGGSLAAGGGISTRLGLVSIQDSTISGNILYGGRASNDGAHAGTAEGGGIASFATSPVVISNSTISNNIAYGGQSTNGGEGFGGSAYGGGIYSQGTTLIVSSTIGFNSAVMGTDDDSSYRQGEGIGGGIYRASASTFIGGSIVATNTASTSNPDVSGSFFDSDYNLVGDKGSSTGWSGLNNLIGGNGQPVINPLFATDEPVDNGGPTATLALLPLSPAIDTGDDAGLDNDQRGAPFVRSFGQADIGAYEFQPAAIGTSEGSTEFTADGPAVAIDPEVVVFDAENITGATVTISGKFVSTEDSLIYPTQIGNITGSYLNGVLTLTGTDTAANYEAAFRSINYANSNPSPNPDDRTVTFAATDSVGTTTPAAMRTVKITLVNHTPTFENAIPPQTATEDSLYVFAFAANTFADIDVGDTLTYTTSALPSWLSFDSATRTFTGIPSNSDVTTTPLTITVTATDSEAETAITTFTLSAANTNDIPTVANPIPPQTATEDSVFAFAFNTNTFADVDVGDTLTYTASGLPLWLSFDGATRTFTGTPTNADVTSIPLTITVTATDSGLATASTTFDMSVTNTNDAPTVANVIAPQTATEDSAFSFAFAANTFADVDVGDTLTYTASSLPSWLSFNGTTRTFTGTPTNADVTSTPLTITVIVKDSALATVSTTFHLSILNTNDAPTVANTIALQTATEDAAFTFTFANNTFADVDAGDTLTYSVSGIPSWLSFDAATLTFTGTPTDAHTSLPPSVITVTAADSASASISTTFQLSVIAVNDNPPVFTAPSQTVTLPELSPYGVTVATVHATDADLPAESLQYSITGGNASGTFTIDPNTGVITVTDSSALVFATNPSFVLIISVTDQGTPAPLTAISTVTINLAGPQITLTENQGTYHIGKATALVDPTATFTYDGVETPNFSGAQLTVSIVAGRSKKDALSILKKGDPTGQIRIKGKNILFGDVKIGTLKGGKSRQPDLVVTFNAQATTAAVDALIRRVNFKAKDDAGTVRTVRFEITNIGSNAHSSNSNMANRDIQVVG